MNKRWFGVNDHSFRFIVDAHEIGELTFIFDDPKKPASFRIGVRNYEIRRSGFWNSELFITSNKSEILRVTSKKWYANDWRISYANQSYDLAVRNNPLVEWVIIDRTTEVLSYGLDATSKHLQVKIDENHDEADPVMHFLLWFLFAPVAIEEMGQHLLFSGQAEQNRRIS
jgi:hypothetical protein